MNTQWDPVVFAFAYKVACAGYITLFSVLVFDIPTLVSDAEVLSRLGLLFILLAVSIVVRRGALAAMVAVKAIRYKLLLSS